jgi:hypothetical protein
LKFGLPAIHFERMRPAATMKPFSILTVIACARLA